MLSHSVTNFRNVAHLATGNNHTCDCFQIFPLIISCWICYDSFSSTELTNMAGDDGETGPKYSYPQLFVERTLALVKPDAVGKAEEIEDIIIRAGFTILQKRRVHLSPEQASDFYAEHFGKHFFSSLVTYMSSGPIVVLMISRQNAISYWRELIGPTDSMKAKITHPDCLRSIYGTDDQQNALHGSDSYRSAEREIRFFFPESIVEPIPTAMTAQDYLAKHVNPTLLKGLTQLCKQKPHDPVIWLADWLLENNPNKPNINSTEVAEPVD